MDMTNILDPVSPHDIQGKVTGQRDAASSDSRAKDDGTQLSVGIDIGSASTQVVVSPLRLQQPSKESTGRSCAVGHKSVYQSPVVLTPYLSEGGIDSQAIGRFVDEVHALAGRGLTSQMDEAYAAELRNEEGAVPQAVSAAADGEGGEQ